MTSVSILINAKLSLDSIYSQTMTRIRSKLLGKTYLIAQEWRDPANRRKMVVMCAVNTFRDCLQF